MTTYCFRCPSCGFLVESKTSKSVPTSPSNPWKDVIRDWWVESVTPILASGDGVFGRKA